MIHLQMAPWIRRHLHPQPGAPVIPVCPEHKPSAHSILALVASCLTFTLVSAVGRTLGFVGTSGDEGAGHREQWSHHVSAPYAGSR